jgi:phosphate transport system substrate-binding protein
VRIFFLILIVFTLQAVPATALNLSGTGDSEILLQRLATEYQRLHPDQRVEVPPSVGSSGGIRMLLQGRTDLARVARPLREDETQQGLRWHKFASAPIVFVANLPQGCVTDLNSNQILKIYNGSYNRWSQLGNCPDQKIYLAKREEDDSSNRILFDKINGLRDLKKLAGKTIYTTRETFETIAAHPYTLGYLPLSQVTNSSLTQFSIDGVMATSKTVINETYRLQLPLALVWKEPLPAEARRFLRFLNSSEAQKLIGSLGAVPVTVQDI